MILKKHAILTFILISSFFAVVAQSTLSGVVKQAGSEKGISNAHVFLENSSFGTVANARGEWELQDIPDGKYLLIISSEGFSTIKQIVTISEDVSLSIEMEENLNTLPELVVESYTLSLGRQGLKDIPGSVDYLGPQELKAWQHSNVNDILKVIPGVNIQEEEGFGLRPNIGLRGSGLERSAKITLMEDGILAAPAPYAAPSAYYFPTVGRMSGVEVMKGSSQVRFGPFTTGGAINFISTPIPNQFNGKVGIQSGNFGYRSVQTVVGNSFKNVGFVVETFQYGADGFKELPNGDDTGFAKSDYQAKLRFNTNKAAKNYQSLTFMIGQTSEDSNETYLGLTDKDFVQNPYQRYTASQVDNMDAEQHRYSVQHYLELPGLFNIVTTAYRNDFKRNWYKLQSIEGESSINGILSDPESNAFAYELLRGSVDVDTAILNVRANNRKYYSQGIQTVVDLEFQTGLVEHDVHISTRFHRDEEDRFQWEDGYSVQSGIMQLEESGVPGSHSNRVENATAWASYLFYKLSYKSWAFTPGIRYENITIERTNYGSSDPSRSGTGLSLRENEVSVVLPGVGVHYQVNNKINLFAGVHKGFAPPGSSVDTDPEESVNYEVGLRKFGKLFSATTVIYLNDYKNLLGADLAAAGGIGSGDLFNAGTALTKGLELQLAYDLLGKNKKFSLPINLAFTYTNAKFTSDFESDFEEWGTVESGFRLPYIAENQLNLGATLKHQRFALNLGSKYQSALRTSPGTGEIPQGNKVDAFFVSDISLNIFLNEWTTFNTSVTNLFDNQYEVARRPAGLRPGMPRAFKVGVNVNL
ncbi:MAG: TonB-dependent receptor [Cyclobacteriaceae bacterium]